MAVTVKGLSSIKAKLNKLEPVTKAAIVRGVSKATAKVEGDAKSIVPVDSGHLRDSIHTSGKSTLHGAEGEVTTSVEYAPYVEFGTSRQGAQPYLHPALQKNKKTAVKIISDEIRNSHQGI